MKKLFKFLIDDIKNDIETLKGLSSGEIKVVPRLKELFNFKEDFNARVFYMNMLVVALAFCCGYLLGALKYETIANNYIIENCRDQGYNFMTNLTKNTSYNWLVN